MFKLFVLNSENVLKKKKNIIDKSYLRVRNCDIVLHHSNQLIVFIRLYKCYLSDIYLIDKLKTGYF